MIYNPDILGLFSILIDNISATNEYMYNKADIGHPCLSSHVLFHALDNQPFISFLISGFYIHVVF